MSECYLPKVQSLTILSYVINSEAAKKLYKTMAGKDSQQPKDLGREWHSDGQSRLIQDCYNYSQRQLHLKFALQTSVVFSWKRHQHMVEILFGALATKCKISDSFFAETGLIRFRYDRISPPMREFLDGLTATCAQPVFRSACTAGNYEIMSPRGSPLNVGDSFAPVHPVVRTNRQTGWKSIFAGVGLHVTRINGLYDFEEKMIRDYILRLITLNHDCIARMHWTKGAAAIWNNSCVWHAATVRYFFHQTFAGANQPNSLIHTWYQELCELVFVLPLSGNSHISILLQLQGGRHLEFRSAATLIICLVHWIRRTCFDLFFVVFVFYRV